MSILEKLNEDMKVAMKEKNSFLLAVIRMAKGAIQLEAINKKQELTYDEEVSIISKQIKMRNDSIVEFKKANRVDLIEQYTKEVELLKKYMPEELSDEEIDKVIEEAFNIVKPSSTKDMGLIMKEISPKLKGRADMQMVNCKIKERLNNL